MQKVSEKEFFYETKILEQYLDSFGHVNHAAYFVLLEQARWDFITSNGYGLDKVKEIQQGPVILGASIKYKKELCNRDSIVIRTHSMTLKNSLIMELQQEIYKLGSNGEKILACEAKFDIGLFDMNRRRLIKNSSEWSQAIGLN